MPVTEHPATQAAIFVQATTPADSDHPNRGVEVGDLWVDTTDVDLKRCTSVAPITFVSTEGGTVTRKAVWFISGNLAVGTEQGARVEADGAWTLVDARAYAKTAPVGAAILVDINDDGVSVFSNDLTIADGANEDDALHVISGASVADLSRLTMDIDQVGSTTPGADLTVELEFTRSVE